MHSMFWDEWRISTKADIHPKGARDLRHFPFLEEHGKTYARHSLAA